MAPDQDPIPSEELPPRWGLAARHDDRVVYRHSNPPIELIADSLTADRTHPRLGLCRCWEVRYRCHLTDATISRPLACVTTRRAALDGLLECMERLHEDATTDDPVAIGATLESVAFSDLVPDERTLSDRRQSADPL